MVAKIIIPKEDVNYEISRLKAIRMLLAFASFMHINLYQIHVECVFLNGYVNKEVYVDQPPSFKNDKFPNHVSRLDKALYSLKQASRAWYERLSNLWKMILKKN